MATAYAPEGSLTVEGGEIIGRCEMVVVAIGWSWRRPFRRSVVIRDVDGINHYVGEGDILKYTFRGKIR